MDYDELDLFIINSIYDSCHKNGEVSTWKIAQNFFVKENTKFSNGREEHSFLTKRNNLIILRLKKMVGVGFIKVTKDYETNKNVYEMVAERVIKGKHRFPDGYKDAIMIKENEGWIILQL